MKNKINLHTHTNFCDGKNSPEEMVLSAIQKNFTILGFSGHSMYPFASDWHIAPREHEAYVKEIRRLAEKYKSQIKILCGFECEYIPSFSIPEKTHFGELNPDYLIGALHYLETPQGNFTVDDSTENVKEGLEKLYKNNGKEVVCQYFDLQRQMLKKGNFEIWAHPDLVRKRNGILKFFSEDENWYKEELLETAKVAAKTDVIVEINTGAIARGAMDDFYPSYQFLEILHDYKIPVCVNSDCHNAPDLDTAFDRAYDRARKIGYKELNYPIGKEIITIKL
ncbi:MAG: histidinol-phosphatase [Treponema sp.]|nr:histidinol-phosphatase [Treponema sp.]